MQQAASSQGGRGEGGRGGGTGGERDASLRVYLFSAFRVLVNGVPVQDQLGKKTKTLFKVLAANLGKRISKDILIDLVWPETDPAKGYASLKVAIHSLRTVLGNGREWIVAKEGTYALAAGPHVWTDVQEFMRRWKQGKLLEQAGDMARAGQEYELAATLYTGDLLEDDLYEDWTIVSREQLKDIYLELMEKLAHLSLASGRHQETIRYCHNIILADPCHEDAYRMLMRSHAALNQIARAAAWYAVCRVMLQREMDALPASETVRAFERLFTSGSDRTGRQTA